MSGKVLTSQDTSRPPKKEKQNTAPNDVGADHENRTNNKHTFTVRFNREIHSLTLYGHRGENPSTAITPPTGTSRARRRTPIPHPAYPPTHVRFYTFGNICWMGSITPLRKPVT